MSVRAYRVNKIETEEGNSFNLCYDEKLMAFLEENGIYDTLVEGNGITEVPVEVLQVAIDNAKELDLDEGHIKMLKADIAWAKDHDEGYVQYYCY